MTRRTAKQTFQTDSSLHASSNRVGDRTLATFAGAPSVVSADARETCSNGSGSFDVDLDLRFNPWKGTERRFVSRKSMILHSCIEADPLRLNNQSTPAQILNSSSPITQQQSFSPHLKTLTTTPPSRLIHFISKSPQPDANPCQRQPRALHNSKPRKHTYIKSQMTITNTKFRTLQKSIAHFLHLISDINGAKTAALHNVLNKTETDHSLSHYQNPNHNPALTAGHGRSTLLNFSSTRYEFTPMPFSIPNNTTLHNMKNADHQSNYSTGCMNLAPYLEWFRSLDSRT